MAIVKCNNGHFYDDAAYHGKCPHCKVESELLKKGSGSVIEDDKTVAMSLDDINIVTNYTGKGNIFWLFSLFSLPFLLLASSKSIGFLLVSLFSLPFCQRHPDKSNPFPSFFLFSLLSKPHFPLPLSPHFPSALKRSRSFLVRD